MKLGRDLRCSLRSLAISRLRLDGQASIARR